MGEGEYHFVLQAPEEGVHTLKIVITFDSYSGSTEEIITVKKGKFDKLNSHASISVEPSENQEPPTSSYANFIIANIMRGMLAIGRLMFFRVNIINM